MRLRLPATMSMPEEFEALFDWIEARGFFIPSESFPGDQLGMLGPSLNNEPCETTYILFRVETPEQAQNEGEAWSSDMNAPGICQRLVRFARVGWDGSYAAIWIDDDGRQHIVYVGSEGEAGILTSSPLDFLRLLAIGYEYIGGDCFERPDEPPDDTERSGVVVNEAFRSWLVDRYGVTVPQTASELISEIPCGMPRKSLSNDPFWRWAYRWYFELSTEEQARLWPAGMSPG